MQASSYPRLPCRDPLGPPLYSREPGWGSSWLTARLFLCAPSAGVGRTGTFIVIDAMMDMMQAEQRVDVFEFVSRIRSQRPQMVQTDVSTRPYGRVPRWPDEGSPCPQLWLIPAVPTDAVHVHLPGPAGASPVWGH